jgi:hypothetical protein
MANVKAKQQAVSAPPSEWLQPERLADIFCRVERGDTSVTDLVYWLQMQEDFLTGNHRAD